MGVHLVTGATGFLGARLARQLLAETKDVIGLARPSSSLAQLDYCGITNRLEIARIDPATFSLETILGGRPLSTVYHTASLSRAGESSEDLRNLVASNIMFPLDLMQQAKLLGCDRFVNASTSWQSVDGTAYAPFNLYAASKQAFEDFLTAAVNSHFQAVSLRLFDTYGPGDTRRKIVDLLFQTALSGQRLAMSPGGQSLNLIHIEDVARAFVHAGQIQLSAHDKNHAIFTVWGNESLPLRSLADKVAVALDRPVPIEWGGRPYRPNEVMLPLASHPVLPAWEPSHDLKSGLEEIARLYLDSQNAT